MYIIIYIILVKGMCTSSKDVRDTSKALSQPTLP